MIRHLIVSNRSCRIPILRMQSIPKVSQFSTSSRTKIRERPAVIKLTDSAANRIMEMIKDKEECVGIKIGVKKRGCNGYSYNMNYAYRKDLENCKDDIVDSHGLKVLVDPKAVFFIVGTTMNYEETELSSEFTFTNPNAKGECGCGESFNV